MGAFDYLKWTYDEAFELFGQEEGGGGGAGARPPPASNQPWGIIYNCERATVELKLTRIALKRPEMLRTYHK